MSDEILDRHIPPPAPQSGLHRGSPSSHELFRLVVELVRAERAQLYGAYFVLVAAQPERGATARALRYMNVDAAALADAARSEIELLGTSSQTMADVLADDRYRIDGQGEITTQTVGGMGAEVGRRRSVAGACCARLGRVGAV